MPAKKAAAKKTTARSDRYQSKNATAAAIAKFEEAFTKEMGSTPRGKPKKSKIITTGSLALDYALTVGGAPTGRIIEMWGPEHAGKTTAAIILAVQFQKAYPAKRIGWVDMEQTFDEDWARALGLDMSKVWFFTPTTAEDVADATKRFVHSGLCSLVVLDSIGGMISRIEMEKEADQDTVGLVPKIVTRMVKACAPAAYQNDTTLCVINQVRANIGSYGPDEDTGGGWALKHVTTMKIQVRKTGGEGTTHQIKRPGDEKPIPVGHKIAMRVQKNKMGPYGQVAEVWLHNVPTEAYGPVGFDKIGETFNFAKRFRLMGSGSGGNYEVEGTKIKGGEPKVMEHLRQHPEVVEALRLKVLETVKDRINDDGFEPPEDESDDPLGMSEMAG
jgi:recombination protein RecA